MLVLIQNNNNNMALYQDNPAELLPENDRTDYITPLSSLSPQYPDYQYRTLVNNIR